MAKTQIVMGPPPRCYPGTLTSTTTTRKAICEAEEQLRKIKRATGFNGKRKRFGPRAGDAPKLGAFDPSRGKKKQKNCFL